MAQCAPVKFFCLGERAGRPAGRRYIEALHDGTDRLHLSSLSLCAYLSSSSTLKPAVSVSALLWRCAEITFLLHGAPLSVLTHTLITPTASNTCLE